LPADLTQRVFYKSWRCACIKAELPEKFSVLTSAVRRCGSVRAGIPERVAMKLTGHTTRSMFDRYELRHRQPG
jgi:hypothetical protein